MAGSYQKTNLDWIIRQLGQRFGEWSERQFAPTASEDSPLSISPELLQLLFWGLVAILGAWVVWQLGRVLTPYWRRSRQGRSPLPPPSTPRSTRTPTAWVQQAQQFYRQENYGEACRSLYLAMVQRLDETQQLPNETSRTNGELLRAIASFAHVPAYRTLIATHEALHFSNSALSQDDYHRCYQAFQEIEAG